MNLGTHCMKPGLLLCLQYAGNVLVYGAMSPCDGDWFGGVNPRNAAEFLDAVINAEVSTKLGHHFLKMSAMSPL